ncbi:hypothetical protein C8E03_10459 [Lachnotalea glycerini]|uniref:Peptidase M50 domain-containing protein n=1 Tax=Lachnotalea glycerini TaxID=1763509 RepID=A0A318EST4_9FIRM|nr:site-2 protease family protein [Lachnotalea glycerini]PXV91052.1 hypothetical protein C8E03_10459 [Lachnotalea glycerini]
MIKNERIFESGINAAIILVILKVVYKIIIDNKNFKIDKIQFIIVYAIFFICAHYVFVFIHEFGHLLFMKKRNIEVAMFVIGPILFVKSTNRIKIKVRFKGELIWGGCVIPYVNSRIKNQESLEQYANDYVYMLMGGVYSSLVAYVICILFFCFIDGTNYLFSPICIYINWSILISLFKKTGNVMGDFKMAKFLTQNEDMIIAILYNSLLIEFPVNQFILEKCEEFVYSKKINKEYNYLKICNLINLLVYKIINLDEKEEKMEEYLIQFTKQNLESKNDIYYNLLMCRLIYHFLLYEYCYESNYLESMYDLLHNFILDSFSNNNTFFNYVKKYQVNLLKLIDSKNANANKQWNYFGFISLFQYINNYMYMIELLEANIINR